MFGSNDVLNDLLNLRRVCHVTLMMLDPGAELRVQLSPVWERDVHEAYLLSTTVLAEVARKRCADATASSTDDGQAWIRHVPSCVERLGSRESLAKRQAVVRRNGFASCVVNCAGPEPVL
jgi:hypothetical protein